MLHPRVPPLVRALPHVESLSLFQAEESQEELETRKNMAVATMNETLPVPAQNTHSIAPPVSSPQGTPVAAFAPPTTFAIMQQTPQVPVPQATSVATTGHQEQSKLLLDTPPAISERNPPPQVPLSSNEPHLNTTRPPSSSISSTSVAQEAPPPPTPAQVVAPAVMEEDEDEEMPGIDMDSDSD